MALAETKHASSKTHRRFSSTVYRLHAAGTTAAERVGHAARDLRTRFRLERKVDNALTTLAAPPNLTEETLSFLDPNDRARVAARFGNLNEHDARKVEPIRGTAANAEINHGFVPLFVENALVNSRHEQGKPFSPSLGLVPDGEKKVDEYLNRNNLAGEGSNSVVAGELDRAERVIRSTEGLGPEDADLVVASLRAGYGNSIVGRHLSIIAERMAKEAARNNVSNTANVVEVFPSDPAEAHREVVVYSTSV